MQLEVKEAISDCAVKREFTFHLVSFFQSYLALHTYQLQNKMHIDVMQVVFIRAVKREFTYHFTSFFQSYFPHLSFSEQVYLDAMEAVFIRAEIPELTISLAFFKAIRTGI